MDWEKLEGLVGDDPEEAMRQSQRALATEKDPDIRGRLLGFVGACHKALGDFKSAGRRFIEGVRLAKAPEVRGELYRRLGMLKVDEGSLGLARQLCNEGILLHAKAGDLEGTGRGLVDSAVVSYHLGQQVRAFDEWKASLHFLEERSARYRFSSFLGMAAIAEEWSEHATVEIAIGEAERLVAQVDSNLQADFWFTKARSAAKQMDYTAAAQWMEKCIDSFPGRMFEKLHYSIYLVLYQLQAGQTERAVATIKAMATIIIQSDEKTDYISGIAMELVRAATSAEKALSVELAVECLEAIQSAEEPRQPSRNRPSH